MYEHQYKVVLVLIDLDPYMYTSPIHIRIRYSIEKVHSFSTHDGSITIGAR